MGRRDTSLTIALCLSLVAHGGVVLTLLERQTLDEKRRIAQPPIDRAQFAVGPILVPEEPKAKPAPVVKRPEAEKLPQLPKAELAKVTPRPLPKPEPEMLKSVFGEPEGHGDAEHGALGDVPMQAKKSAPENQAFLSRDPAGPGRVGDKPSQSMAPPGEGGQGKQGPIRKASPAVQSTPALPKPSLLTVAPQRPAALPQVPVGKTQEEQPKPREVTQKPDPAVPFGVPSEKVEEVLPKQARKVAEGPKVVAIANPAGMKPIEGSETARDAVDVTAKEGKKAVQAPPPPKPVGAPPVPEEVAKPALVPPVVVAAAPPQPELMKQEESGGRPGKPSPAADPARMSDSESDAFGKVANVEFKDGQVEAQFGRRIKTVRPKLLLSAQYEIFTQPNPRVLLSAKVDDTGHVTKVDIYQSSGTPDLDQPCLVAVYDWWFEPPKDKNGKPMPDVVVVSITFRNR